MRLRNCQVIDTVVNEANKTHSRIIPMAARGYTRAFHTLPANRKQPALPAAAALTSCHSQHSPRAATPANAHPPLSCATPRTKAWHMRMKEVFSTVGHCHAGKRKREAPPWRQPTKGTIQCPQHARGTQHTQLAKEVQLSKAAHTLAAKHQCDLGKNADKKMADSHQLLNYIQQGGGKGDAAKKSHPCKNTNALLASSLPSTRGVPRNCEGAKNWADKLRRKVLWACRTPHDGSG